jgi:hypothetical protein
MDESPRQLIVEVRKPLAMKPGSVRKYDTEYVRNGTADVFVFTDPHLGWRRADVTSARTSLDWAHQVKQLVDINFPDAEKNSSDLRQFKHPCVQLSLQGF